MKKLDWSLIIILIPLGEIHKVFYKIQWIVDPFISCSYPLDIQWIIKDNTTMLQFSIVAFLLYRVSKYVVGIKEFRIATKAILIFSFLDIFMYWINFKSGWYGVVYFLLIGVLIKAKIFK